MSVLKSYVSGIAAATRRPKMVALLWLMNLVFALPAFFVFRSAFRGTLGDSLAADGLLNKTDINIIFEFLTSSGVVLGLVITAVLVIIVLHVLAYVFAFGGILNVLTHEPRDQRFGQVFFGGGGRFYGRFFRLVAYSIVLWVPVGIILLAANGLLKLVTTNPAREQLAVAMGILRVLLFLFLVFFVEMILDYARIKIALTDTRQVFRALVEASRFVFSRPLKSILLYYMLGLTGWAAFGACLAIHSRFSETSAFAVFLGFLITQAFIASRAWLRVAYQAAQKDFLESSIPGMQASANLPT
ncbi:MAG: hypothetical protein A2W03_10920 [Candidatus Aminicenantes bacterium RBG_16_63_16]|nr:MAG: hypothetical protein A2W03_10920 [Candidatus Aminicenantes bacterium RBG_16_63_16]